MNLQDQQLRQASESLMRDIDFVIFAEAMQKDGWHLIELDRLQDNRHAVDITYWLTETCQGKYRRNGRRFLFKNTADAVMFKLRWA